MAFAKPKAHLRKAAARTIDALLRAVGDIGSLFTPEECWNFFKAHSHVADQAPDALGSRCEPDGVARTFAVAARADGGVFRLVAGCLQAAGEGCIGCR